MEVKDRPKKCGLTVMLAKVVTCSKVENDVKYEFISVGAAIWGSNAHKYYELVLYKKPKDDYISRIVINESFEFKIETQDTAAVSSEGKIDLNLKFTYPGDLREFAIHVGLARWIVSDMRRPVTQEIRGVESSDEDDEEKKLLSEPGDHLEMYYVAKVVGKDHKFGAEVANNTHDGRPLGLKIGSEWDKGLIGATPGCQRLIIIPHHALGIWKCLVPNYQHLSLLVDIARFGKSESDFNIWPIGNPGPNIPSQGIHSRACRPGLITHLFNHGQNPPMRGAIHRQPVHFSPPFGIEQNLSIHPYKLLQYSRSRDTMENITVALFETLTQMKVSNSKAKELATQLQIRNLSVRENIERCLRANLKLIHEVEESVMEVNEQRNVDQFFMRHPEAVEVEEEKLGDEAELNSIEMTHPFEKNQPEVKIFTCEGHLPEISQLRPQSSSGVMTFE